MTTRIWISDFRIYGSHDGSGSVRSLPGVTLNAAEQKKENGIYENQQSKDDISIRC
jgi:hypothetical protein